MRQLSWEFFFIYSNPGKIITTQKISTYELIFFDDEQISEVHHHRKICLMQNDRMYHHQRTVKINAIKRQKPAFSQHSHSQDMIQKFESVPKILNFVYSQ